MSGTTAEGVVALGRALRDGSLDSVTLTRGCLDRIAAENPRLNAFFEVFEARPWLPPSAPTVSAPPAPTGGRCTASPWR
ncbi:MAG: hypothetical protein U5L11_17855 [Arhodomonas sp.]|nr:hypothetical protein [Arhodomonas sp.]